MANAEKFSKAIEDEQLDEVAGGTIEEMKKDIKFLKAMGFKFSKNATQWDVYSAWREVGVALDMETDTANNENEYKKVLKAADESCSICVAGNTISRQDAMIIAMRNAKVVVDLDKYL